MILAMLLFTARVVRRRWAGALAGLALLASGGFPTVAGAQGVDGGYLPSGGGAFVPFRGGPGGGVGVMPSGPRSPAAGLSPTAPGSMGRLMGSPSPLGSRGGLAPLRPIGVAGGMGMGASGLVPRPAPTMRSMPRPAVGSYPFRIPPSLRGGASQRPSMAM